MSGAAAMREFGATAPVPEFDEPAFTPLGKPLPDARVAIVTSAALHRSGDEAFSQGDTSYRSIDRADRDLVLGHWSPNFDRSGFQLDLNVVYPIDRLEELSADGVIGSASWSAANSSRACCASARATRKDASLAQRTSNAARSSTDN